MKISLRGVRKKNAEKVKGDLKSAFVDGPEVSVEEEVETGGTVHATVIYPAHDTRDRKSVELIIDTVIMQNDYIFCSVCHRDAPTEEASGTAVVAPGWPSL